MPAPKSRIWKATHIKRGVAKIDINLHRNPKNEMWVLLRTDAHTDSPKSNTEMELRHLRQARERDAMIIDNGDLFDAMGGKWDRRNTSSRQILPVLRVDEYLDALPEFAADRYEKFSDLFGIWGTGNHETAMTRHHQVDLTGRLLKDLNARTGTAHKVHGYSGWVVFAIHALSKAGRPTNTVKSFNMRRHHGFGGSAPATRGTLKHTRMMAQYPDAQIIFTGHDHNEWQIVRRKERITHKLVPYLQDVYCINSPGYKGSKMVASDGWEVEMGFDPKTAAAHWLRFAFSWDTASFEMEIRRAA